MEKRSSHLEAGGLPLALLAMAFAMISTSQAYGCSGQIEAALDRYMSADGSAYAYEVVGEPVTIVVNGGARPSRDLQGLSAVAVAIQTPIAILGSVPNQPLYGLREDALESYFGSEGRFTPSGFIVTGGSKRGWTSWLSAAANPRVVGIMPMVHDNLNLKAQSTVYSRR